MDTRIFKDASDDVNRVVLCVINYLLASYVLSGVGLSSTYVQISSVVLATLSFIAYFVITPSLILVYLAQSVLLGRIFPQDLRGFEELVAFLILLFLVPVLDIIRADKGKSSVTAATLIASVISPLLVFTLPLGPSFKKDLKYQVLSILPLLYLGFSLQGELLKYIAFLIFVAVAAYLFSIQRELSLIGALPAGLAVWFLTSSPLYAALAVTLSLGVNAAKTFQLRTSEKRKEIEGLGQYRNGLLNRVTLFRNLVGKVGQVSNLPELREYINQLDELSKNVSRCQDMECLRFNESELDAINRTAKTRLNDYIFRQITQINEFSRELKKMGVVVDEMEYPGELELGQDMVVVINQVREREEKLYDLAGRFYRRLVGVVRESLGWSQDQFGELGDELSSIQKIIDAAVPELNQCEEMAAGLVREEAIFPREEAEKLTAMHLEYRTIKSPLDRILKAHQISREVYEGIEKFLQEVKAKYIEFTGLEDDLFKGKGDVDLILASVGKEQGVCPKLRQLSVTWRLSLDKLIEDLSTMHKLRDVSELVDSMREELVSRLKEDGCVNIVDMGLEEEYSSYLVAMLRAKGIQVKPEGSQICLKG
ncbi:hypothetical protein HS1genome_0265 [Sulfodiicoccus acidiphilus]|uniref:Uncharacterized protein n=1 Tax=Sulfodiicoccus acidiphilus TaxID=1670455 RepID=A0A348B124_9CREN|nr:hypothetical protein [Sulfodiicoccus acidiphilus]BBD71876.1 hypothetical protein HS1genome_0265 [Sulfodiicoccus acidiphilus]GGT91141.1 hypothetical protein GCM10007116_06060 [Sulfodiicoccus acidiphilus]